MALAHPLPKRLPALYHPLIPVMYHAHKCCNHVQISVICFNCEFFLANNCILINRMTKNYPILFLFSTWASENPKSNLVPS